MQAPPPCDERNATMSTERCPAWADGQHLFYPAEPYAVFKRCRGCGLKVDRIQPGATVERAEPPGESEGERVRGVLLAAAAKASAGLGPLCPESGMYQSRCVHCGAEPLNAAAPPGGTPPWPPRNGDVWRSKKGEEYTFDGEYSIAFGYHNVGSTTGPGWWYTGAFRDGTLTFVRAAAPPTFAQLVERVGPLPTTGLAAGAEPPRESDGGVDETPPCSCEGRHAACSGLDAYGSPLDDCPREPHCGSCGGLVRRATAAPPVAPPACPHGRGDGAFCAQCPGGVASPPCPGDVGEPAPAKKCSGCDYATPWCRTPCDGCPDPQTWWTRRREAGYPVAESALSEQEARRLEEKFDVLVPFTPAEAEAEAARLRGLLRKGFEQGWAGLWSEVEAAIKETPK